MKFFLENLLQKVFKLSKNLLGKRYNRNQSINFQHLLGRKRWFLERIFSKSLTQPLLRPYVLTTGIKTENNNLLIILFL